MKVITNVCEKDLTLLDYRTKIVYNKKFLRFILTKDESYSNICVRAEVERERNRGPARFCCVLQKQPTSRETVGNAP